MQPIESASLQGHLQSVARRPLYLHLETTSGAYTTGAVGAFIRNAQVQFQQAAVRGEGPYRVGLQMESGWIYAEGLTHWEQDEQGRLLMAGYDGEGRLSVALELSTSPFRG